MQLTVSIHSQHLFVLHRRNLQIALFIAFCPHFLGVIKVPTCTLQLGISPHFIRSDQAICHLTSSVYSFCFIFFICHMVNACVHMCLMKPILIPSQMF